jgi:hypothetical protein
MKRAAKIRMITAAIVMTWFAIGQAARIDRIDIYDKADNHLLFATFAYDSTGANIGRSVFTSDSTFLRTTTFQPSGTGVKETSVDFNNSLVFATTTAPSAGGTAFSTVDQFGMDQFGGAMTATQSSANNYDISQNTTVVCKEQYQFGADGTLNRINILDKSGSLTYYALVTPTTGALSPVGATPGRASLISANRGRVNAVFSLVHSGRVCVEAFTLTGRRAAVLVDKMFEGGNHAFAVSVFGQGGSRFPNGAYVVRLTIDGVTAVSGKMLLER